MAHRRRRQASPIGSGRSPSRPLAVQESPDAPAIFDAGEMQDEAGSICRACGACCSFSREWPRFSLEDDAALARIPPMFVDHHQGGMRCEGDRCAALVGEVGEATSCAVYAVRPDVCRACVPGDDACRMARSRFQLDGNRLAAALMTWQQPE
jgi:hypothetical protein